MTLLAGVMLGAELGPQKGDERSIILPLEAVEHLYSEPFKAVVGEKPALKVSLDPSRLGENSVRVRYQLIALRPVDLRDAVEFELEPDVDDMPIYDPEQQAAVEAAAAESEWGWCMVRVRAVVRNDHFLVRNDVYGLAILGGCSYADEEDFINNSGMYEPLQEDALDDLRGQIERNLYKVQVLDRNTAAAEIAEQVGVGPVDVLTDWFSTSPKSVLSIYVSDEGRQMLTVWLDGLMERGVL